MTIITQQSAAQFADRIAALVPNGWAGSDAKATGVVRDLFLALGSELSGLLNEVGYLADATRLKTETDPELDIAGADFFGSTYHRPNGMSDSDFAALIIANLFKSAATRPAFLAALSALTGSAPRLLEPWNISDTGGWSATSYWNVDTVDNPARWGNGSLRYQGYIETPPPLIPAVGSNNPVLSWGTAYWNEPGYFFGIIPSAPMSALYDLINRLKAEGITIWVKITTSNGAGTLPPSAVGNLVATASGYGAVVLTWTTPTGSPPFSFTTFYRVTGTTQFQTGPTVGSNTATISGLQDNVSYDFEVITRNKISQAASGIVSATTLKVAPGPATGLTVTGIGPTAATLSWIAPTTGTPPFLMQARYRVSGMVDWIVFGTPGNYTTITVTGLLPATQYDFDVTTSN